MYGRITKIWIALLMLAVFILDSSLCNANPIESSGVSNGSSGSITTYDQRQTGKYNLHVNIKDVQVFSISDSLAGIGGDYESDYGDYATLEGSDDGSDYDISHLTVNPIFAFLGSRPTTTKKPPTASTSNATSSLKPDQEIAVPTTTTEKAVTQQLSNESPMTSTSTLAAPTTIKQDIESEESKPEASSVGTKGDMKPQQTTTLKVNETIDYEEIPVEVLYYRNQHNHMGKEQQPVALSRVDTGSKLHHHNTQNKRRPSVVIIDTHGRSNNNVKILNDHPVTPMVKICGSAEFRDKYGKCRNKHQRRLKRRDANHLPGGL